MHILGINAYHGDASAAIVSDGELIAAVEARPEPDDLAQSLRELVAMDDRDRQAMGKEGLALVTERFTWPTVARQMREVYDWVLGGGPRPDCVLAE